MTNGSERIPASPLDRLRAWDDREQVTTVKRHTIDPDTGEQAVETFTVYHPGYIDALRSAVGDLLAEPTVRNEAEANALRHGAVLLDRNGDAFQKTGETGWQMTGESGRWSASWIAFPALVLHAKPPYEEELAAENQDDAG